MLFVHATTGRVFVASTSYVRICPLFVARDLSGLGWVLKESYHDTGEGSTGGETDADPACEPASRAGVVSVPGRLWGQILIF
jgi:hypothetical protein